MFFLSTTKTLLHPDSKKKGGGGEWGKKRLLSIQSKKKQNSTVFGVLMINVKFKTAWLAKVLPCKHTLIIDIYKVF